MKLPTSLLVLLRSQRVRKVGVHIKADLTRLYKDCGFLNSHELPFVGAVELGQMAKERNVTDSTKVSLSDLAAAVLKRNLSKDLSIRLSTEWDSPSLSEAHQVYAALDAYASWSIFDAFISIPIAGPVTSETPPGTEVQLLSRSGNIPVAYGFVARHQPKQHNGVNVTKTRTIITVKAIKVPGYLVRSELLASRIDTPLSDLTQQLPFNLLCSRKDLRTCNSQCKESQQSQAPPPPPPQSRQTVNPQNQDRDVISESEHAEEVPTDNEPPVDSEGLASFDYDPEMEQSVDNAERDSYGLLQAHSLGELLVQQVTMEPSEIRARILGDIFHLMHQFKISMHHGLRRPFARALRDAIFLPDPDDKAAVEGVLSKKNISFDQKVLYKSDWVWQRVKRLVPPPEILTPRVIEVLQKFGPLKDAITGEPLFNNASWEKAQNVIENVRMGYFSDPPGVMLYTFQRKDKDGLSLYRCLRGTNNVEGGIHQNIVRRFGSFNASPRLTVNLLRDYVLCHNLRVSVLLSSGLKNMLTSTMFERLAPSIAQVQHTVDHSIFGQRTRLHH